MWTTLNISRNWNAHCCESLYHMNNTMVASKCTQWHIQDAVRCYDLRAASRVMCIYTRCLGRDSRRDTAAVCWWACSQSYRSISCIAFAQACVYDGWFQQLMSFTRVVVHAVRWLVALWLRRLWVQSLRSQFSCTDDCCGSAFYSCCEDMTACFRQHVQNLCLAHTARSISNLWTAYAARSHCQAFVA